MGCARNPASWRTVGVQAEEAVSRGTGCTECAAWRKLGGRRFVARWGQRPKRFGLRFVCSVLSAQKARMGGFASSPEGRRYFAELYARRSRALPVQDVAATFLDGSEPQIAQCHQNVNRYVAENPGLTAVRGWLVAASDGGDGLLFAAHSIAATENGALIDITPRHRRSAGFLAHRGDEELFARACDEPFVWWPLLT